MNSRSFWKRTVRPIKPVRRHYTHSQQNKTPSSEAAIESAPNGSPEKTQDSHAQHQPISGAPRPHHAIPPSPIMDPAMNLAIMKYRAPKQRPSKELSPLQVK